MKYVIEVKGNFVTHPNIHNQIEDEMKRILAETTNMTDVEVSVRSTV